jgi:hypothetical protein
MKRMNTDEHGYPEAGFSVPIDAPGLAHSLHHMTSLSVFIRFIRFIRVPKVFSPHHSRDDYPE